MSKIYFENEKEAVEFLHIIFPCSTFGSCMKVIRENNFIKKPDLEIAREEYEEVVRKNWEHLHEIANDEQFEYLDKSCKFIRTLEKALEEKRDK